MKLLQHSGMVTNWTWWTRQAAVFCIITQITINKNT